MSDMDLIADARAAMDYSDDTGWFWVGRLADALEARQPTVNDRTPEFEAIEQELFKHQPLLSMQDGSIRGCKCMDRVFVTKTEDWGTHLAEVFMRLPRAVVPDAATEGDYHEGLEEGVKIGRAERDAALAAVDRVRALHTQGKIIDVWGKSRSQADDFLVCVECTDPDNWWIAHPCATVAALDGAPEPEEKQ